MKVVNENLDLMAKLMTASTKRHSVHAANIANINTPNYIAKEMNFEDSFRAALKDNGAEKALDVSEEIVDSDAEVKADGNSVHLEREFNMMQKNQMLFNVYAQMLKHKMKSIKHAISGTR
ncbi:MAG: flagellar basal-body rod protein FlgB [Planctomycetota bacterium]|jgi:flagellar basal-body rod protein FlgB